MTDKKRNDEWTADEQAVFAELGVREGDLALRKLIRGQRRINGRLYDAIDLILKHLKKSNVSSPELEKAERINDAIPGEDPPRCESVPETSPG